MGRKCKCLIVDDHPIFRKGIKDLLCEEGLCSEVVEAISAQEALTAIRRESWDLLVLDVALPDKHGLEVLKEAKHLCPAIPVLMLSLYPEREFALRAIKGGASGYLTKDRAPSDFVAAVKNIVAGRRYITPSLANQMANHFSGDQSATLHDILSNREMEVLRLLGQGKTVSGIADVMVLSVKTVSTYRRRLLDKLRLRTTAELIRYAVDYNLTM